MAVARSRALAGSPHHVGRNGRVSSRSSFVIPYHPRSTSFDLKCSTSEGPPTCFK